MLDRRRIGSTLAIVAIAWGLCALQPLPTTSSAQEESPEALQPERSDPRRPGEPREEVNTSASVASSEAMEIFGQILQGKLMRLFRSATLDSSPPSADVFYHSGVDPHPGFFHSGPVRIDRPSAVYVEGHGVVLHARVPGLRGESAPRSSQSESLWEKTRRHLRGEASGHEVDQNVLYCGGCHQMQGKGGLARVPGSGVWTVDGLSLSLLPSRGQLVDELIRLLAENGRHFTQLGRDEEITVGITVDSASPSAAKRPSAGGESVGAAFPAAYDASELVTVLLGQKHVAQVEGTLGQLIQVAEGDGAPGQNTIVLTGDLHMRQGKYDEAIKLYKQAVDALAGRGEAERGREETSRLTRKLIQAYVAAGRFEEAKRILDVYAQKQNERNSIDRAMR